MVVQGGEGSKEWGSGVQGQLPERERERERGHEVGYETIKRGILFRGLKFREMTAWRYFFFLALRREWNDKGDIEALESGVPHSAECDIVPVCLSTPHSKVLSRQDLEWRERLSRQHIRGWDTGTSLVILCPPFSPPVAPLGPTEWPPKLHWGHMDLVL